MSTAEGHPAWHALRRELAQAAAPGGTDNACRGSLPRVCGEPLQQRQDSRHRRPAHMPEPVPQPGMDGLLTDPELGRRLSLTGAGFDQPSRRVLISGPAPFHRGDQLQGGLRTA